MPLQEPKGWSKARSSLLGEMLEALEAKPPRTVNLSIPKHAISTFCLWEITYDESLSGKKLSIRWNDGSGSQFPCGVLPRGVSEQDVSEPTLRLGLMSFRHPELDYIVDLYACRNRELASLRSMAAEEEYSFQRARSLLTDSMLELGALIEVYHTGLEPMVVGFYRGVVSVLVERVKRGLPRTLHLVPKYYVGAPEREGLGPHSSGADPSHYLAGKVWG